MQPIIIEHAGAIRGKERPRATIRGGRAAVYTSAKQNRAEASVRASAMQVPLPAPFSGPVSVSVRIFRAMPVSWSKKKKTALHGCWIDGKPDSDNVLKTIFDAFNGLLWLDDKQVAKFDYEQIWADISSARIVVSALTPQP